MIDTTRKRLEALLRKQQMDLSTEKPRTVLYWCRIADDYELRTTLDGLDPSTPNVEVNLHLLSRVGDIASDVHSRLQLVDV